jgi:tyrosyl-tRNA synthetase
MDSQEKQNMVEGILTRGVAEIITEDGLRKKLLSGKKLRIKYGIDPTSKNIHLGRAVALLKLRDLQELGHRIIFIVGDFTGVIGDTSDKESERPMLSGKEVKKNMKAYVTQAKKILLSKNLEVRYNSKWLSKLTYREIGRQADIFSLADFISRENIKKRLNKGSRISLREVLYPIMQGYDSVAVRADLEIGGTDQKFNMLAGRKLQEHFGQSPQDILMVNIIEGTDGRKMSSSWGNTINILDEPNEMFGKVMSLPDSLIITYFTHCTRVPLAEIKNTEAALAQNAINPRDAKLKLAEEITKLYHGSKKAVLAREYFIDTFTKHKTPEDIPKAEVYKGETLCNVAVTQGIVSSKTEWRRLVDQGAIENIETKEKINNPNMVLEKDGVFKIGKKRFIKIIVHPKVK